MARIELKDFNLGGESESMLQGNNNSLYRIVGFDLHKEPGILSVANAVVNSPTFPNQKPVAMINNGETYIFCSDVGDNANGFVYAYDKGHLELEHEFDSDCNDISNVVMHNEVYYYASKYYLGQCDDDLYQDSDYNDKWATFSSGVDDHPMEIIGDYLYIGDGYNIAAVDGDNIFTAVAFEVPKTWGRISVLSNIGDDLLIGIDDTPGDPYLGTILRWDRFSSEATSKVSVPEWPIFSMTNKGGIVYIQAGEFGNWYAYNGSTVELVKRFRGNNHILNNAIIDFRSSLLLGLGEESTLDFNKLRGIYSMDKTSAGHPTTSVLKYILTPGTEKVDVISLGTAEEGTSSNVYTPAIGWENTTTHTYGLDVVHPTYKSANAYIETKVLKVDRAEQNTFKIKIAYKSYLQGIGQSINVYSSVNYAAYGSAMEATIDTDRNIVEFTQEVPGATTVQFKVEVTTSGSSATAPEIESIIIDY